MPLSTDLIGTWQVIDRIDRGADGREYAEPNLGADPIALLFYDASGHFGAQFMRRARSASDATAGPTTQGANNTRAGEGYDAYFGTWSVDDARGLVTQTLLGALARDNVGMVITREMTVSGDILTIRVPTTAADGKPIVRTLRCRRLAG